MTFNQNPVVCPQCTSDDFAVQVTTDQGVRLASYRCNRCGWQWTWPQKRPVTSRSDLTPSS